MRVEGLVVGVRVVKEGDDVGVGDGSWGASEYRHFLFDFLHFEQLGED